MGRPKGSSNKVKETHKKEVKPEVKPEIKIEPKVEVKTSTKENNCICNHPKSMHYGSLDKQCNTRGCECARYS